MDKCGMYVLLRNPSPLIVVDSLELTGRVTSSATDNLTTQAVAIKKITEPFHSLEAAKRSFREVKLLRHLRHGNVSSKNFSNFDHH